DRGELVDAVHAQVADGERAAAELVRGELPGAGAIGEVVGRGGDLAEALAVGVAHDRDDEPVVEGDGDADVDVAVADDPVPGPRGVDLRVAAQRHRTGPDEQVGDGDPGSGGGELLVDLVTEGEQRARVDDAGQVEVGRGGGAVGEPLRGDPPDRGQRDLLVLDRRGDRRRGRGCGDRADLLRRGWRCGRAHLLRRSPLLGGPPLDGGLHVGADDAAVRAGPGDGGEVHAAFAGDLACERGGGRTARGCGGRGRRRFGRWRCGGRRLGGRGGRWRLGGRGSRCGGWSGWRRLGRWRSRGGCGGRCLGGGWRRFGSGL